MINQNNIITKEPLVIYTLNVNNVKLVTKVAKVSELIERIDPHEMIMTELTMLLTLPSPIYPAASKDQDTNGSGVLCLVKKGIKFHPIIEEEIGKQIQI